MSYLVGPMTLTQVPQLNELAGVQTGMQKRQGAGKATPTATTREAGSAYSEKPGVSGVSEYFITSNDPSRGDVFAPALLAIAEIRYLKQNPPVDYKRSVAVWKTRAKKPHLGRLPRRDLVPKRYSTVHPLG